LLEPSLGIIILLGLGFVEDKVGNLSLEKVGVQIIGLADLYMDSITWATHVVTKRHR
jgi:hypothetical protein